MANAHSSAADSDAKGGAATPVVIKKYANRRLYNTETSSYITLDHLAGMTRAGRDFQVFDARSGDDITRSVLTQIVMEEESTGQTMLPVPFEQLAKQNLALFQAATSMLGGKVPASPAAPASRDPEVAELKAQLAALQARLDGIAKG